ncbi:T9SS type A sorting domain-containing protein [Hymenobacter nivis]|uniref:T9SS C-terminal target domain-containing protein n=1 Tax=Hymenobacter nivis TaxID=1850093 RepID=A0A502GQ07_9BACT|nr:T9SS type A sorting domain-containing protein [Hymenobacter nivis]TPG63076.1 T9SS C-terminal target domain-containing protein [Hymenobacter nivis]
MKILFFILCGGVLALHPAGARAQAKAAAPKAAAKPPVKAAPAKAPAKALAAGPATKAPAPAAAPDAPAAAHVALAPTTPAADPTALKIKAEVNPTTRQLAVHTNAPGPTTIEVNDATGRPVLTRNVMAGAKAIELNVSQLPAGYYVVHCTAGLRTGMRRVHLGD